MPFAGLASSLVAYMSDRPGVQVLCLLIVAALLWPHVVRYWEREEADLKMYRDWEADEAEIAARRRELGASSAEHRRREEPYRYGYGQSAAARIETLKKHGKA